MYESNYMRASIKNKILTENLAKTKKFEWNFFDSHQTQSIVYECCMTE